MRFVIVTGGPLPEEASDVIRNFAGEADTKVIACDSGCDHLAKTGIVPDVVIPSVTVISLPSDLYCTARPRFAMT